MGGYPQCGRESEMTSGHARWVRLTHWMAAASVAALAFSGVGCTFGIFNETSRLPEDRLGLVQQNPRPSNSVDTHVAAFI